VLDDQLTSQAAGADRTASETAVARAERARLICELGMPEPALNDALEILKKTPDFLPAERVVIAAHLASGATVRAAGAAERALTTHAADPGAPDPELQRLAGLAWQAQGKHAQAVEALSACLARSRRADLLRARAQSLRQLQRFAEATQDVAAADALEAVSTKEDSQ
jgi:tetratricopeptide (TPR) repeat protein